LEKKVEKGWQNPKAENGRLDIGFPVAVES
jgi:hypothetical protein